MFLTYKSRIYSFAKFEGAEEGAGGSNSEGRTDNVLI